MKICTSHISLVIFDFLSMRGHTKYSDSTTTCRWSLCGSSWSILWINGC